MLVFSFNFSGHYQNLPAREFRRLLGSKDIDHGVQYSKQFFGSSLHGSND